MKKFLSLVLALVLCLSTVALAEAVPSKTTEDVLRARVEATAENGKGFSIIIHDSNVSNDQLARLQVAASLDAYFGNIVKSDGTRATLNELMGSDQANVFEFTGIDVADYQAAFGQVHVKTRFSTLYKENDKVVVLIGVPGRSLTWSAFEAKVVDNQGTFEFDLTPDMMLNIQKWTGLIAVASLTQEAN